MDIFGHVFGIDTCSSFLSIVSVPKRMNITQNKRD